MIKRAAQFLFSFLLIVNCYLLIVVNPAFAQTQNPHTLPNNNPDVPVNLHTWSQNVMIEVLAAASCQLTGIDPITRQTKCLGVDQKTGKIGFVENGGGAIGLMSYAIGATFTKPMGTVDYVDYLASNFGVVKPAYAQTAGIGFSGLSPLSKLWVGFRNIVYMFFIIIFVIVGVAIMLRVKIDPRTVMSIENQIPKIIIGIILVTFSFAIAGVLIDFMWVLIYLIISVLAQIDPTLPISDLSKVAISSNPFQAMNEAGGAGGQSLGLGAFIGPPANSVAGMVSSVFDSPGLKAFMGLIGGIIGTLLIKNTFANAFSGIPIFGELISTIVVGAVVAATIQTLISFLTGVIASIVIGIALLWALFRLWFALLSAYVYILLDVIFAPFWIVGGIIPGSSLGFTPWLRSLSANLLAFPVTIGLFTLGAVFMRSFSNTGVGVFVPPLVGNPGTGGANPIGPLIGLGIIFISPQVVAITKELLKAPQLKQGAAAGQPLAVGLSAINIPKHVQQLGMFNYYADSLRKNKLIGWALGADRTEGHGR